MKMVMAPDLEPWCDVVRIEFAELPAMRLTLAQAQRLWSLEADLCRDVLAALVRDRFLVCTADGCYCRADCLDGPWSLD